MKGNFYGNVPEESIENSQKWQVNCSMYDIFEAN